MPLMIHKYALDGATCQRIPIPAGGRFLSAAEQYGKIVVYALVDPTSAPVDRSVWIFGTGHEVPAEVTGAEFLGTVKLADGRLMFHVFAA